MLANARHYNKPFGPLGLSQTHTGDQMCMNLTCLRPLEARLILPGGALYNPEARARIARNELLYHMFDARFLVSIFPYPMGWPRTNPNFELSMRPFWRLGSELPLSCTTLSRLAHLREHRKY